MIKNTKIGAISSNLIGPTVMFYVLFDSLPNVFIYSWLIINIALYIYRVLYSNILSENIHTKDKYKIRKNLIILIGLTTLTAGLYGVLIWVSVIYNVTNINLFLLMILMITLAAGSISTLTSVRSEERRVGKECRL